jgi:hypothetical protein
MVTVTEALLSKNPSGTGIDLMVTSVNVVEIAM